MILDKVKTIILNNKVVQLVLIFIVGVGVGALFYPTKIIKDELTETYKSQISELNDKHSQEIETLNLQFSQKEEAYQTAMQTQKESIDKLTQQVTEIKSSANSTHHLITHPDGSKEEWDTVSTATDDKSKIVTDLKQEYDSQLATMQKQTQDTYQSQISSLQAQWSQKEQSYQTQISTLQQTHSEVTNPKSYGIEAGATLNGSYYLHGNADVWGPFFVGTHAQIGSSNTFGAGVGLRF